MNLYIANQPFKNGPKNNIYTIFICNQYQIKNSFCSDSGVFIGKFQGSCKKTLQDEILSRSLSRNYFQQQGIWLLLLSLSKCAVHIYYYGQNHSIGNIHPYNILIGDQRYYKIIVTNHSFSLPNQLDHFNQNKPNSYREKNVFKSPQYITFLSNLKQNDYSQCQHSIDKNKSQSFCIGLTLLSMATLNLNMSKIYKNTDKAHKNPRKTKLHLSESFSQNKTQIQQKCQDQQIEQSSKMSFINTLGIGNNIQSSHIDNILNLKYLNSLMLNVKEHYSFVLYDVIKSLLHPEPEFRTSIIKIYQQLLKNVEEYIINYDNKWINSASRLLAYQIPSLSQQSQQICFNWLIHQSKAILSRQDSKIQ